MMTDVPWDGSYPWRKSALKRTMPNGDEFTTVIDPSVPDSDTQIAGLAGLGLNRTVFSVVVTTNVAFTLLMMVQNAHPLMSVITSPPIHRIRLQLLPEKQHRH
jgi:hypothetical protein